MTSKTLEVTKTEVFSRVEVSTTTKRYLIKIDYGKDGLASQTKFQLVEKKDVKITEKVETSTPVSPSSKSDSNSHIENKKVQIRKIFPPDFSKIKKNDIVGRLFLQIVEAMPKFLDGSIDILKYREELIKKYGVKDENGKFVTVKKESKKVKINYEIIVQERGRELLKLDPTIRRTGKKVIGSNLLKLVRPDVYLEINFETTSKECKLSRCEIDKFTYGKRKPKIMFNCLFAQCDHHLYSAAICNRTIGGECSFCNKQNGNVCPCDSVYNSHPKLMEELDPKSENNKKHNLMKISYGTNVRLDWKCPRCGNLYSAILFNRTTKQSGCPDCGCEDARENIKLSLDEVDRRFSEKNFERRGPYKGSDFPCDVFCKICKK